MSRLTVLQSIQTALKGELERVYIYPDDFLADFDAVDITAPFHVIEELPVFEKNTIIRAADWIDVSWVVALFGFISEGEKIWMTEADAIAKSLTYAHRNTVRGILESNMRPYGVSAPIGDDRRTFTDFITPLQWNKMPYFGYYFEIPVTSG